MFFRLPSLRFCLSLCLAVSTAAQAAAPVKAPAAAPQSRQPTSTNAKTKVPPATAAASANRLNASNVLHTGISKDEHYTKWLLEGQANDNNIPKGTRLDLSFTGNLNSEISQKGDEVLARICLDVKDGSHVLLPGGWYVHGLVTDVSGQKRLGRDGYVEVEFDRLISPDGAVDLPFSAKLSTKDNQMKSIAKVVAIDSGYVAAGSAAGAVLSVQMTGLPVAIATHGISVGVGAAAGGTIGLIGALKRKGKIASIFPGDELKITVSEPIALPGFNPQALLSAAPAAKLSNLDITVDHHRFEKDPLDSHARLLEVDLSMNNHTNKVYKFFDLAVVSDHNQYYYARPNDFHTIAVKVKPGTMEKGRLTFGVDSPKRKYYLVLLDRIKSQQQPVELARVPIN